MERGFRVFLLDDDRVQAQALATRLVAMGYDVEPLGSADELFRRLPREGPGCVITEGTVGGCSGIDIQDALACDGAPAAVVFLVRDGSVAECARAMRGGAVDYLTKPASLREVLDAVQRAEAVSQERHRAGTERTAVRERLARLTPREHAVLQLVLAGRLNKQIAAELSSREATVKVHRSRLMRKLETRSLAELLRLTRHIENAPATTADAGAARALA